MPIVLSLVLHYVILNVTLFVIVERIYSLLCTMPAVRFYKRCWSALASTYYVVLRNAK